MASIDDFNHEIPGINEAYKPLPDKMREKREADARAAKEAATKPPEEAEVEPPAAPKTPIKAPRVAKKRARAVEMPYTLGTLELFSRAGIIVRCSAPECRQEIRGPLATFEVCLERALNNKRMSWTVAMNEEGGIVGYCHAHRAPADSQAVRIVRDEEMF